jgi:hypothetical protein
MEQKDRLLAMISFELQIGIFVNIICPSRVIELLIDGSYCQII